MRTTGPGRTVRYAQQLKPTGTAQDENSRLCINRSGIRLDCSDVFLTVPGEGIVSKSNRRKFLKNGMSIAGAAALAGPYQGLLARPGNGHRGINNGAGYGPLFEARDKTTGEFHNL